MAGPNVSISFPKVKSGVDKTIVDATKNVTANRNEITSNQTVETLSTNTDSLLDANQQNVSKPENLSLLDEVKEGKKDVTLDQTLSHQNQSSIPSSTESNHFDTVNETSKTQSSMTTSTTTENIKTENTSISIGKKDMTSSQNTVTSTTSSKNHIGSGNPSSFDTSSFTFSSSNQSTNSPLEVEQKEQNDKSVIVDTTKITKKQGTIVEDFIDDDYKEALENYLDGMDQEISTYREMLELVEKEIESKKEASFANGVESFASLFDRYQQQLYSVDSYVYQIVSGYQIYCDDKKLKELGLTQEELMEMDFPSLVELCKKKDSTIKEQYEFVESFKNELDATVKEATDCNTYEDYLNLLEELEGNKSLLEGAIYKAEQLKETAKYDYLVASSSFQNFAIDKEFDSNSLQVITADMTTMVMYRNKGTSSPLQFLEVAKKQYIGYEITVAKKEQLEALLSMSEEDPNLGKIYNYLYSVGGVDLANQYLDDILDQINLYAGKKKAEQFLSTLKKNEKGEYDYTSLMNHLKTTGKGLGDGVESFFAGIGAWFASSDVYSIDEYETLFILEGLQENKDFLNFLDNNYEISQSVGNMLPSIALGIVTSPLVGSISMGVSAGGNSYHSALVEGANQSHALFYGVLSGLSETVLEHYLGAIPGLQKVMGDVEVTSIKTFAKKMLQEGIEEGTQEYVDALLQTGILGQDFDLAETTKNAGKSAFYGSLIGGLFNAPNLAISSLTKNIEVQDNDTISNIEENSKMGSPLQQDNQFYLLDSEYFKSREKRGGNLETIREIVEEWDAYGSIPKELGVKIEEMINDPNITVGIHRTGGNGLIDNKAVLQNKMLNNIFREGLYNNGDVFVGGAKVETPDPAKTISPFHSILDAVMMMKSPYKDSAGGVLVAFPSNLVDSEGGFIGKSGNQIYNYIDTIPAIKPEFLLGYVSQDKGHCQFYPKEMFLSSKEEVKQVEGVRINHEISWNDDLFEITEQIIPISEIESILFDENSKAFENLIYFGNPNLSSDTGLDNVTIQISQALYGSAIFDYLKNTNHTLNDVEQSKVDTIQGLLLDMDYRCLLNASKISYTNQLNQQMTTSIQEIESTLKDSTKIDRLIAMIENPSTEVFDVTLYESLLELYSKLEKRNLSVDPIVEANMEKLLSVSKKYYQKMKTYRRAWKNELEYARRDFIAVMNEGVQSDPRVVQLLVDTLDHQALAGIVGDRTIAKFYKNLTKVKRDNPKFHLQETVERAYFSHGDKGVYVSQNDILTLNSNVILHELGHGLFDLVCDNDMTDWAQVSAKARVHLKNNVFIDTYNQLVKDKLQEVEMKLRQVLLEKTGFQTIEEYKEKRAIDIEKQLNQYKAKNLSQLLKQLNLGKDLEESILSSEPFLQSFQKKKQILAKKLADNHVSKELKVEEERLDGTSRLGDVRYAISDILGSLFELDGYDPSSRSIKGLDGKEILLTYLHEASYYKTATNHALHEVIANYNALRIIGSKESLELLRNLVGPDMINYLENTFLKMHRISDNAPIYSRLAKHLVNLPPVDVDRQMITPENLRERLKVRKQDRNYLNRISQYLSQISKYTDDNNPTEFKDVASLKKAVVQIVLDEKLMNAWGTAPIMQLLEDPIMRNELIANPDFVNAISRNFEFYLPEFKYISTEQWQTLFSNPSLLKFASRFMDIQNRNEYIRFIRHCQTEGITQWTSVASLIEPIQNMTLDQFSNFIQQLANEGMLKMEFEELIQDVKIKEYLEKFSKKDYTLLMKKVKKQIYGLEGMSLPLKFSKNMLLIPLLGGLSFNLGLIAGAVTGSKDELEEAVEELQSKITNLKQACFRNQLILGEKDGLKEGYNFVVLKVDGEEKTFVVDFTPGKLCDLNEQVGSFEEVSIVSIEPYESQNVEVEDYKALYKITCDKNGVEKEFFLSPTGRNMPNATIEEILASENPFELDIDYYLYDHQMLDAKVKNIETVEISDEKERVDILSLYPNSSSLLTDSKYGGNQSTVPLIMLNYLEGQKMDWKGKSLEQVIKKHYPEIGDMEMINVTQSYSMVGCGFMAIANTICIYFDSLENGRELFKERFGYDLYQEADGSKDFNVETIALDFFLDYHDTCSYEDLLEFNEDYGGTDSLDTLDKLENFLGKKGVLVDGKLMTVISENDLWATALEDEEYFTILLSDNFDLQYVLNEQISDQADLALANAQQTPAIMKDIGSHAMLVTGVDEENNLLVSSWSMKFKFLYDSIIRNKNKPGISTSTALWKFDYSLEEEE